MRSRLILILLFAVLLCCAGCATQHRTLELDAQHPAVSLTTAGVKFGDEFVEPGEVAEILEDYDVPHDRVIHIQLEPDVKDLRPARMLMALLARAGYTRPVLVTHQHAESVNLGMVKKTTYSGAGRTMPAPQKKTIRYKGATD